MSECANCPNYPGMDEDAKRIFALVESSMNEVLNEVKSAVPDATVKRESTCVFAGPFSYEMRMGKYGGSRFTFLETEQKRNPYRLWLTKRGVPKRRLAEVFTDKKNTIVKINVVAPDVETYFKELAEKEPKAAISLKY